MVIAYKKLGVMHGKAVDNVALGSLSLPYRFEDFFKIKWVIANSPDLKGIFQ